MAGKASHRTPRRQTYRASLARPDCWFLQTKKKKKKKKRNINFVIVSIFQGAIAYINQHDQGRCKVRIISVRDEFRSGGLKSLARIFFQLLARKSSGFARILPDLFFLPENGYLKNSRGAGCSPPQPHGPYAYGTNYLPLHSPEKVDKVCVCVCVGGGGRVGHRRMGPVSFMGLRSVARIFFHCLPENQVVLPEYYIIFARKWLFEKFDKNKQTNDSMSCFDKNIHTS